MNDIRKLGPLIAAVGLISVAGCNPNQRTDTPAERAGRDTVYAGDRAADDARRGADRTGDKASGAFNELKKDTKEAVAVLKVKNAFITDDKIDAEDINVDGKEMTIHLYGTVSSAAEKKRAEQVAKNVAGQAFKVMSHLQIANSKKQ